LDRATVLGAMIRTTPVPFALALALVTLSQCASTDRPAPASVTTVTRATALRDPAAPVGLVRAIGDGSAKAFPLDRAAYARLGAGQAQDWADLPIGVFDSGIGGLTVLSALLDLDEFDNVTHQPGHDGVPDFADERFIYYGDQANMPYGRYASVGREDFLRELIVEDATFLLGRRYWPSVTAPAPKLDKPMVKAVVVACNTATAYGIEDLRAAFQAWNIPMILVGVVEAGAQGAVTATKERKDDSAVAVMATVGTCKSEAYPKTIARYASDSGLRSPRVVQQGSVGLAGAIEGDPAFVRGSGTAYQGPAVGNSAAPIDPAMAKPYGFDQAGLSGDPADPATWHLSSVENYVRYDVATLVEGYRRSGGGGPIGTVVLGCTHFPFERDHIAAAFDRLRDFRDPSGERPYAGLVAEHVDFVDPARLTAKELYVALDATRRFHGKRDPRAPESNLFFLSKPNASLPTVKLTADRTFEGAYKYGRTAGHFDEETVRRVPMRTADLTPELRGLLQKSMPAVWASLEEFQVTRWVR
jgi:glutamate racemase